jgi:ketosteroid isomerase-like protein
LYNRTAANAADDLITTIADYGSFLASVMNHEGLSDVVYQSMQHPEVPTHNSKHFCLGFERYDFKDGNYALSHGGADKGSQCIFFIFPKTKQGLLIFTDIDDGYKVFEKLIVEHLGDYGKEIVQIELGRNLLSDGHDTEGSAHHKRNNYHGDSTLYQTISSLDSVFFNAYNNCDLETQSRMYADDIEFYHDLVGLTTSKGEIIEATKRNICGRVTRERMEGSIEVYSIADYGAVQLGLHKFHNSDNPDERPESSRFIIIWKAEENHWKISRVISLH